MVKKQPIPVLLFFSSIKSRSSRAWEDVEGERVNFLVGTWEVVGGDFVYADGFLLSFFSWDGNNSFRDEVYPWLSLLWRKVFDC